MFGFQGINLLILDSSMVEHSAVNRVVVGSSPTRGAKPAAGAAAAKPVNIKVCGLFRTKKYFDRNKNMMQCLQRQAWNC